MDEYNLLIELDDYIDEPMEDIDIDLSQDNPEKELDFNND